MSLISEKTLVVQGNLLNNKGVWEEENVVIFGSVIKNDGQIEAKNRVTIVGMYLAGSASSLSARKVERFSSVHDLLDKVKEYKKGAVQEKSEDDAKEIMNHLLRVSHKTLIEKLQNDEVRENFFSLYLGYKPDVEDCKLTLSLVLHTMGIEYANGKIPGKGAQDALILLEEAYAFYPDNEHIRKNLLACISILCMQYIKGEIPSKSYADVRVLMERFLAIEIGQAEMKKGISEIVISIVSHFMRGEAVGQSLEDIYGLVKRAVELDPDNKNAQEALSFYSGKSLKAKEKDETQGQAFGIDREGVVDYVKKAFLACIKTSDFQYSEDVSLESNLQKAVDHFLKVLTLHPDDPELRVTIPALYDLLSSLYVSRIIEGKSACDGVIVLEKAYAINPNMLGIKSGLSVQCYVAALMCMDKQVPEKSLKDGASYLARSLEFKNDLKKSAQRTLALTCNRYALAYDKGLIEGKTTKDAIELFELAIEMVPDYALSYYNLGAILLEQKDDLDNLDRVLGLYEKSFSLDPTSDFVKKKLVELLRLMISVHMNQNDKTLFEMVVMAEKAFLLNQEDAVIRAAMFSYNFRMACFCLKTKDTAESLTEGLKFLERGLIFEGDLSEEHRKNVVPVCNHYAVACLEGKMEGRTLKDAITLFGIAMKLDKTDLTAHMNLMQLCTQLPEIRPIVAKILPDYAQILEMVLAGIEGPDGEIFQLFHSAQNERE